jgi:hypothetical protein
LEKYQNELKELTAKIARVKEVEVKPGIKYTPPPIIPIGDIEMPSKILLVDDEKVLCIRFPKGFPLAI